MSFFGEQDWWQEDKQRETSSEQAEEALSVSVMRPLLLRHLYLRLLLVFSGSNERLLRFLFFFFFFFFFFFLLVVFSLMFKETLEVLERSA